MKQIANDRTHHLDEETWLKQEANRKFISMCRLQFEKLMVVIDAAVDQVDMYYDQQIQIDDANLRRALQQLINDIN